MNKGMVIVKMWFKNGAYIEKEVEVKEELPKEEAAQFISVMEEVQRTVKSCFVNNADAQITVQGMTVRVSELIACDFAFPSENEGGKEI